MVQHIQPKRFLSSFCWCPQWKQLLPVTMNTALDGGLESGCHIPNSFTTSSSIVNRYICSLYCFSERSWSSDLGKGFWRRVLLHFCVYGYSRSTNNAYLYNLNFQPLLILALICGFFFLKQLIVKLKCFLQSTASQTGLTTVIQDSYLLHIYVDRKYSWLNNKYLLWKGCLHLQSLAVYCTRTDIPWKIGAACFSKHW